MLAFIVGLFVGSIAGVLVAALCCAAGKRSDMEVKK